MLMRYLRRVLSFARHDSSRDSVVSQYLELRKRLQKAIDRGQDDKDVDLIADELSDLGEQIAKQREPKRIADLISWESDCLRIDGMLYMIDRDAATMYDQVEGFCDLVIMRNLGSSDWLKKMPQDVDGYGLCEWINLEFPENGTNVLDELLAGGNA